MRTNSHTLKASVASLHLLRIPFLRIRITAEAIRLRQPRSATPSCTRRDTCLPLLVIIRPIVGDQQLTILTVASRFVTGDPDNGEPTCGSMAFAEDAVHLLKD